IFSINSRHNLDISPNHDAPIISYTPETQSYIPSYYDSRDYGYITPVKNQENGGNCWAFGTIATLEACLKKATGITYDLSENNGKNLMTLYSLTGTTKETNGGVNQVVMQGYLASWLGPVDEIYDVYDDSAVLSAILSPLFHIQNILWLPARANSNDNDLIKRAIMDYGAVAGSCQWTSTSTHEFCIVGWDDNYKGKDFFGSTCNGAWIVKNSWGNQSQMNGYLYISYERDFDGDLSKYNNANLFTFIINDDEGYIRNYQYEVAGETSWIQSSNQPAYYKNTFQSKGDELLSAVSTFFKYPTDYSISIYKGNELVLTQNGHSNMGYYTIPLSKKIELSTGDVFTVMFKNSRSGTNYIPVCYDTNLMWPAHTTGVSFYSFDGSKWTQLNNGAVCIKAFTSARELKDIEITSNSFANVAVGQEATFNVLFKEASSEVDGSLIEFTVDGETYHVQVKNARASLKMKFSQGTHTFSAQYRNNIYRSNVVGFDFDCSNDIVVSAPDVTKYYGGAQKFTVKVTQNNLPVSTSVTINVNGVDRTMPTNANGEASIDLNLPVGNYVVTSYVNGKAYTSNAEILTTISSNNAQGTYSNAYVTATFYDANGNYLKNSYVKFRIGSTEYSAKTDNYGYASRSIDLDVGTYDVYVVNSNTGEQKRISLKISKATPAMTLKSSQSGNVVTVTATMTPSAVSGTVRFYIDGGYHSESIKNGVATLELYGLKAGTYPLTATYQGNGNYNTKEVSSSVAVTSTDSPSISASDVTCEYLNSYVDATFYDSDGNYLKKTNVTFKIDSVEYIATTNSYGHIKAPFSLDVGSHIVILNNPATLESLKVRLTVTKKTPSLSFILYDCSDYYLIQTSISPFASGGNLTYTYKGVDYTTSYNGYLRISPTAEGDYLVNVRFSGDKNLNPASHSYVFAFKSKADIIESNPISMIYGESRFIDVKLLDCKGNALSDSKIYYSIVGRNTYFGNIKTDSNGLCRIAFSGPSGTYSVKLTSDNNGYREYSITVYKATPTLKAGKKTFKAYKKTKKYKATLMFNGVVLSNKFITLKVKGKTYTAKTNSWGKATFKIKKLKKRGSFKATVSFAGDDNLNQVSKKVKIKVK
ncbi:Ig-like domain repeat protein, partial [Methanobrevibacter sp.]|uniref:Ig-like domain repeat protein n=1 Tax=Methanobrevibacter sp. TaxID=66852 RepID=UPI00386E8AC8